MKKGLFSLLSFLIMFNFSAVSFSQGELIFEEEFNNNRNGWPVADGERIYSAIQDGKYFLKQKVAGSTTTYNSPKIENKSTYTIESIIRNYFEFNVSFSTLTCTE